MCMQPQHPQFLRSDLPQPWKHQLSIHTFPRCWNLHQWHCKQAVCTALGRDFSSESDGLWGSAVISAPACVLANNWNLLPGCWGSSWSKQSALPVPESLLEPAEAGDCGWGRGCHGCPTPPFTGHFTAALSFHVSSPLVAQTVKHLLQCRRPGFDPWEGKISCRRKWQPTPVFLPGKSHGRRSLVGYSLWGQKESDMTEQLHFSVS